MLTLVMLSLIQLWLGAAVDSSLLVHLGWIHLPKGSGTDGGA